MMNEWIISSSVLIAAVLLGRFLLRGKISLRLQYALWGIVLLRLLLPFQIFTSPFGTGAVSEQVDLAAPVRQVYHSANEDRYEEAYDTAYREVKHSIAIAHPDPIVIEQAARELAQSRMELDLARTMFRVWLVGMAAMAAVIVGCNVHLAGRLRRHRWEMEVPGCLLPVYVTEVVPTPCVFGLFRPAIYLTPQTAEEGQVRDHVLEHELTHYRHLDHIWSVLRSLCLVLHWYNPLVWAAAKVSRADAELACDEGALSRLGEEARGDYGRTLIGLTCSAPISDLLLTATTMTGSPGSIRERIKLLMKRPRNTALTITALVLMVTLIVGCTFAGAPETTAPTETTNPGVDNDMSYRDQDLSIPEDPAQTTTPTIQIDGLLAYPGTRWFMTENEVLAALGLTARDILQGAYTTQEDGMTASSVTVNHKDAFGVSMVLDFTFRAYWPGAEPVLTEVYGHFIDREGFEAVRSIYARAMGDTDTRITPGVEERWDSQILLRELVGMEGYEILDRCAADALNIPAAHVQWVDNGTPEIIWSTELPGAETSAWTWDPVDELSAIFGLNGSRWYLAALTATYADGYVDFDPVAFFSAGQSAVALTKEEEALVTQVYGKDALKHTIFRMTYGRMVQVLQTHVCVDAFGMDLSEFLFCPDTQAYILVREEVPQLRMPQILACEDLPEDQVRMTYRFPGEEQTYCATLRREETWKVFNNQLLTESA